MDGQQFGIYDPIPLTLEAAKQLAFRARIRLGIILVDVPALDLDETRLVLPGYALALSTYLQGQYQLPWGFVGGALVHYVIRTDIAEMDPDAQEQYALQLMGWRTILSHPELLLELLEGTADYMLSLHNAHMSPDRYTEIMETQPKTRIGRILAQATIRAVSWKEIDLDNN